MKVPKVKIQGGIKRTVKTNCTATDDSNRDHVKGRILLNNGATDLPPFANGAHKLILFYVTVNAEKERDRSVNSMCKN